MLKFPQAIKDVPQWAVCGFHPGTTAEKQPYVWDNEKGDMVPLRKDGTQYGLANLHLLMSFEDTERCIKYYNQAGHNLMSGFYLMPSDPFCCIDMDIKEEWTVEQVKAAGDRYQKIVQSFHSYTEISRSGNGLHLWLYSLPQDGKRRDGVEIYSQYRFIICTGNHWDVTPLEMSGAAGSESEQYILNLVHMLRSEMGDATTLDSFKMLELTEAQFDEDPYALSDVDLYVKASEAANGILFRQLWEGRWQANEVNLAIGERIFPSQSEAEFALIDIIAFYTKYNFQVRKMFMRSDLSSRYDNRRQAHEKVKKPYHLEQMIKKRRKDETVAALEVQQIMESNVNRTIANLNKIHEASTPQIPPSEFLATNGQYNVEVDGGLAWPPGFVGELARHMFATSLRPVKDVAILSALALMSGICGKVWNTHTNGGLNNYIILVARSGLGKDAFRVSMQKAMDTVEQFGGKDGAQLFGARSFVDTSRYASEQALMKATICPDGEMARLSFVHYIDEISSFLGDLANNRGKAPELAHSMLSLYNAGSFHSRADGLKYSNKENNHAGGRLAAYSLAGECTPSEFYSQISPAMLAGGFVSRLIVWDCEVLRPLENKNIHKGMPPALLQALGELVMQAVKLSAGTEPVTVELTPDAEVAYDNLDLEVNEILNGVNGEVEKDEVIRQAHNRRGFKILKMACLLAVGDNCFNPKVTMTHFKWAKMFIDLSNDRIIQKHREGAVGSDAVKREKIILNKVLKLVENKSGRDQKTYPLLADLFVVTKSDIRVNTVDAAAFSGTKDKVFAFDNALQSVCQLGALRPLAAAELREAPYHDGQGKVFRGIAFLVDIDKVRELIENT